MAACLFLKATTPVNLALASLVTWLIVSLQKRKKKKKKEETKRERETKEGEQEHMNHTVA